MHRDPGERRRLIAAGLLSVAISPAPGLALLRRQQPIGGARRDRPTPVMPVIAAEDRAPPRVEHVGSAAS
jgi:hypothetical protein